MNKKELLLELKQKGFSQSIIDAFNAVDRKSFVPEELQKYAYENNALPTANGSTISQPSTIAFMLDLLMLSNLSQKKRIKIFEIGSGSGYVLALLHTILQNLKIKR